MNLHFREWPLLSFFSVLPFLTEFYEDVRAVRRRMRRRKVEAELLESRAFAPMCSTLWVNFHHLPSGTCHRWAATSPKSKQVGLNDKR